MRVVVFRQALRTPVTAVPAPTTTAHTHTHTHMPCVTHRTPQPRWGTIDDTTMDIHESKESVWIKVVFSWLCYGLYALTLMLPPCCPDRDFPGGGSAV